MSKLLSQRLDFMYSTIQNFLDKSAIGLSLMCAAHCLLLPVLTILIPSLLTTQLADESFHLWLLLLVTPISAYALTSGTIEHRDPRILILGITGLSFLFSALIVPHEWETALTLIGSAIIVVAHGRNFYLCNKAEACECR